MNMGARRHVHTPGEEARHRCGLLAAALGSIALLLAACAGPTSSPSPSSPSPSPRTEGSAAPKVSTRPIDATQAARLQRVWTPLLAVMNHPLKPSDVQIGLMDDPHINAANAGGGKFLVTTGLLQKANDDQLQAVLAYETAHQDLGHVAKAQALGTGLNIGMVILDQIIPGSGALTPIAGQLVMNKYSQKEEYAADRHGMEILQKAGMSPDIMPQTLTWLMQTEGTSGGGFFSNHPATGDRIEALRRGK